jgi:hypothetical protein
MEPWRCSSLIRECSEVRVRLNLAATSRAVVMTGHKLLVPV